MQIDRDQWKHQCAETIVHRMALSILLDSLSKLPATASCPTEVFSRLDAIVLGYESTDPAMAAIFLEHVDGLRPKPTADRETSDDS